jgi:CelD/BcsL family acetyltransferase involved in cellulose biosynthesis
VAVAEEDGRLLGGAAFQLRRRGGPLGVWAAGWLGPTEQLCSPDLLVHPAHPEAAEAIVAAVLAVGDAVALAAPAAGPTARALRVVAPWSRAEELGRRWTVPWPPPRLAYARRRAGFELRRAARRGGEVEVCVAAEPAEVAAALVRLFRVHRDRWSDLPDESLRFARTRALRRWNAAAADAMAAAGNARIAEVAENGRTVGACLGFLHGRGGIAHTQALRVDATLREPGHIAVLACVEALVEAGASRIDLGPGSARPGGPKTRLGAIPEPIHGLFAARDPARQRAFDVAHRVQRARRRVMHR